MYNTSHGFGAAKKIVHVVKKGDYLGKIAKQYNTSLPQILRLNPDIKNPDKIFIGQKIFIGWDWHHFEDLMRAYLGLKLSLNVFAEDISTPQRLKGKRIDRIREVEEMMLSFPNTEMPEDVRKSLLRKLKINNKIELSLYGPEGATSGIQKYLQLRSQKGSKKEIDRLLSKINVSFTDIEDAAKNYISVGPELRRLGIDPAYVESIKEHKPKGVHKVSNILEQYIKQNEKIKENSLDPMADPSEKAARAMKYVSHLEKMVINAQVELEKAQEYAQMLPRWVQKMLTDDSWERWNDLLDTQLITDFALKVKDDDFISKQDSDDLYVGDIPDGSLQEQALTGQEKQIEDISDIVVDEINTAFNDLPANSPLKSREVALAALEKIKSQLPAMIKGIELE